MDIAVSLVEAYLRAAGYLTLSEVAVFRVGPDGRSENVTDIDVVGLRLPGDVAEPGPDDEHPELTLLRDPVLQVEDCIDLIIGEVKQGEARFNKGIHSKEALHSILHRVRWLFPPGGVDETLEALSQGRTHTMKTWGDMDLRVRLVAFGQSDRNDENFIGHSHILKVSTEYIEDNLDIFRGAKPSSPAAQFLVLLAKTGHHIGKDLGP